MSTKKHLIILILKLLESESDREHPLTQRKLCEVLSAVYPCDRKTVGRNIKFLQAVGYPIVKTPKGFYLEGKSFSVEEVRFVKEALAVFPEREGIDREALTEKLTDLMTRITR